MATQQSASSSLRIYLRRDGQDGKDGKDGEKGEDALSVNMSSSTVLFHPSLNTSVVTIQAFRGAEKVALDYHTAVDIDTSGVTNASYMSSNVGNTSDYIVAVTFTRTSSSVEVSGTVSVTVAVDGAAYALSLTVVTVDPTGVADLTPYYLASALSSGVTTSTSGWTASVQTMTPETPYLWRYEVWSLTDGTTKSTTPVIVGFYSESAVQVYVSPETLLFDDHVDTRAVEVTAMQGTKAISLSESDVSYATDLATGVMVFTLTGSSGGTVTLTLRRNTPSEVSGTVTLTIAAGGVTFTRYVNIATVADGADGANGTNGTNGTNGSDGADAVSYDVGCQSATLSYYPGRGAYAPDPLVFYCLKSTGSAIAGQAAYWRFTVDGKTMTGYTVDVNSTGTGSTGYVNFSPSDYSARVGGITCVTAAAYSSSAMTLQYGTSVSVETSSNAVLRGPQNWDDVAVGYAFEDGSATCTYLDVVYRTSGNETKYYMCKLSHTKAESTGYYPGDTNSAYWTAASQIDMVATKLLLATYAKVDNLYVDDLYMESEDGLTAIWINPALNGMAIQKRDALTASGRENQDAAGDNWTSPTTKFHAGQMSTLEEKFGGTSGTVYYAGGSSSATNTNMFTSSGYKTTEEVVLENSTGISVARGQTMRITNANTGNLFQVEPDSAGTSYLNVEMRLYEGNTGFDGGNLVTVLQRWCLTGISGAYTYYQMGDIDVKYTAEAATTLYIELWSLEGYRSSVRFYVYPNYAAFYYAIVTDTYVSEFAANGFFVGLNSANYMRMGIDGSAMEYHMITEGGGLSSSSEGQYQVQKSQRMPLGMTLMCGYVRVVSGSPSTIRCRISSFDGNLPTVEYKGPGNYGFTMPYQWAEKLGDLATDTFCVTCTPCSSSSNYLNFAQVTYLNSDSRGRGIFFVSTYDDGGAIADCDFYFRVDYLGIGGIVMATQNS